MKSGQQIRLSKQGQAGINGGENGDLYIEITYQKSTNLYVEGTDVYLETPITPWEAALGEKFKSNYLLAVRLKSIFLKTRRMGKSYVLKTKGFQVHPQAICI